MAQPRRDRFVAGPIGPTILRLTGFMILGMLGMVMFNLVDTYFVGRLGGDELAAMSFTFPVVLVVQSIALGLGIGTSSVVSRAIGRGDHRSVQRLTTDALVLSVLIVVLVVVAGILTIDPLFRALGADARLIPLIREYMVMWYIGVPFVVIPMVGNNAIRSTGDTLTPSVVMLVAVLVNLVLDPLFIFGIGPFPEWGLFGAAFATVAARATTLVVSLTILAVKEKMITLTVPSLGEIADSWRRVLFVGLPAAATNVIIPLSIGVLTRLVASHGSEAVAGYGVASRIEMFALTFVMALNAVIGPFTGQNVGAGKPERAQRGMRYAMIYATVWSALVFLLFLSAAEPIAALFNRDEPDITGVTVLYLLIIGASYVGQSVMLLVNTAFSALGKPMPAAALSLIRMFVLAIPLAVIGERFFAVAGIFFGLAAANLLSGLVAHIWYRSALQAVIRDARPEVA